MAVTADTAQRIADALPAPPGSVVWDDVGAESVVIGRGIVLFSSFEKLDSSKSAAAGMRICRNRLNCARHGKPGA